MDFDVEGLRAAEAQCIHKFQQKARALRDADPGMSAQVARAKAAASMPKTMEVYLATCSRLTFCGLAPIQWK
jgi:hypothetical protein